MLLPFKESMFITYEISGCQNRRKLIKIFVSSYTELNSLFCLFQSFCSDDMNVDNVVIIMRWVILAFSVACIIGNVFIKAPHSERTSFLKHLELMTGLSPWTYWLSFFIWDLICYSFSVVVMIIIITSMDHVGLLSTSNGTGIINKETYSSALENIKNYYSRCTNSILGMPLVPRFL